MVALGTAFAQKTVTGQVIDSETGEAIPGAAVKVVGTTLGAATDVNGRFTIQNVPSSAKLLNVSFVGMKTKEVGVNHSARIALDPDSKLIDDVMVVAYGAQKKGTFTGSAAEIKAEDIASHVASDVTSALSGTTAGVMIVNSSGDPANSDTKIRLRGIGSMSASSNPLIILDGMPFDADLSFINPNDVGSMTVLKDAAAAAIYGARGANGVIIITTKKGKHGDAQISFDAKWGSNSRLIPQYNVITDPGQYYETAFRQLYNSQIYDGKSAAEAYNFANSNLYDVRNGGLGYQVYTLPEGQNLIGTDLKLNPNARLGYSDGQYYYTPDDWFKETYHNSFRQEYTASVSGATEKLNYFVSAGFLKSGGVVDNSSFKRYTSRANLNYDIRPWFNVAASLTYAHTQSDKPSYDSGSYMSSGNLFYIVNNMGPIYPLYVRNADGSIKTENGRTIYDSNQTNFQRPSTVGNAVRDNKVDFDRTYVDLFTGNWTATFKPVKGLTLSAKLGVNVENRRRNHMYSQFGSASASDGSVSVVHVREYSYNNQYLANYQTDFGSDDTHHLDVLAGYEQYKTQLQFLSGENTNLYDPFVAELGNAVGTGDSKKVHSSTAEYMTEGFFARAQYDYMEKYVVSGSFRRDASSRYAKGHRWGNFYSAGLGWMISKESFMEGSKDWLDMLKLKVSYGEQGNDMFTGDRLTSNGVNGLFYPYADMYSASYNSETGQYSTVLTQKGNENLTWEKNRNFNVGLDFGLWKNRLSGTIEFFTRNTSDQIYYKPTPLSSGIVTGEYPVNVGSVRNTGVELTLNGTPIKTANFTWDLNLNLTHFKNKITSLDNDVDEEGIKRSYYILKVGGSVYQAYMYKYAGVLSVEQATNPAATGLFTKAEAESIKPNDAGKALYYMDVKDDDGKVIDQKLTTDFSKASQYDCGTTLPKLMGGFGTSLKFYGVDISAQFQFQLGGKFYDGQYQTLMHTSDQSVGSAWHKDAINAWSISNQGSDIPRLTTSYAEGQSAIDRYMISSNFLSINNVTIGYTFPNSLLANLGISKLRVYVAGENLAVFTKRKGMDPRFSFGTGSMVYGAGASGNYYSAMRTITAGISLSF